MTADFASNKPFHTEPGAARVLKSTSFAAARWTGAFVVYANPRIQLRYFSGTRHRYGIPFASDDWGGFMYFIEIDDQYVIRQVNCHENGAVVRYDRTHWCDDFGMMFVRRFSRKQKADRDKKPVTVAKFERVWTDALSSPIWSEQIARSREQDWGTWADRVALRL